MTTPPTDTGLEQRIDAIRAFNRMYMNRIGLTAENIFGSSFTPAEVRILNELSASDLKTASALSRELNMDGGYLSRILHAFEKDGLISKARSTEDARQLKLSLTKKGRKAAEDVSAEARRIMLGIVSPLPVEEQIRLVSAMNVIDRIVNRDGWEINRRKPRAAFRIRDHRIGDMGRIVHSHAVQFAADYGWNHEFELLIAEKAAEFLRSFDPSRERCLIADIDGHLVGSIFLCKVSDDVGEARLPFVAPEARGMGIGKELLGELVTFARKAGYKKLEMRTESVVDYAAAMFRNAGFALLKETQHACFGKDLVRQDWEMPL